MKNDLSIMADSVSAKTLKNIEKYYEKYSLKEFRSSSGETGEYLEFIRDTKRALKAIFADINFRLVSFNKMHFCYSCFVQNNETGLFAKISSDDVRIGNVFDSILVCAAKHGKDFSSNGYRSIGPFETLISNLKNITKI